MTYTPTQPLTTEQFIATYGDNTRYELADGERIDRSLTSPHETIGGKLAMRIGMAIAQAQLPWFIPRTCLIQPSTDSATARRPDLVVLDAAILILKNKVSGSLAQRGFYNYWQTEKSPKPSRLVS
jgi:hypothetical protein